MESAYPTAAVDHSQLMSARILSGLGYVRVRQKVLKEKAGAFPVA